MRTHAQAQRAATLAEPSATRRTPPPVQQKVVVQRRAPTGTHSHSLDRLPVSSHRPAPPNRTGLPDRLKSGVEALSGVSLDAVNVHYNSSRPGRLGALAYAQGTDIHLAPGQERHLPHEAWHVVQQAQGRVRPTLQMKDGPSINVDRGLEREADTMGSLATAPHLTSSDPIGSRDAPISSPVLSAAGSTGTPVLQPMLGFEIEMLVLVDLNGRPIPEKTHIGTCGAHITLDVDHGPSVAAPTITHAADARYDIDQHPGVAPGAEVAMLHNGGGPADPRLPLLQLDPAAWQATTNPIGHQEFTRPASPIQPLVNNTALALIDAELTLYRFNYRNWEPARCRTNLTAILAHIGSWLATNTAKPNKVLHPNQRARWRNVRDALVALRTRTQAHLAFWNNPAHNAAPVNLVRAFRPAIGLGAGAWHHYAPLAGQGANRYASILEIVTDAYPPETAAGRLAILAAMADAATLAGALETAGGAHLTTRAPLAGIPNVAGVPAGVHFGNPHQPAQTTNGSVQVTGALDLAQLPSYLKSIAGKGGPGLTDDLETNSQFRLKHHSDTDDDEGGVALAELPLAVANATAIINQIKVYGGGGPAPDLVNLRGLVTLICQYLRFGRHFFTGVGTPLDKNIVPLLSRTDLAQIYDRLVPANEKAWLAGGGRLNHLIAILPAQANRNGVTNLFNDTAQTHVGGVTCHDFVYNIFNGATDGVAGHLGGFREMDAESVDPGGLRGGDTRHVTAPQREGLVFELRNLVKRDWHTLGRFPRTKWVHLAEQQIALFSTLNARAEATATEDKRVRWAGYGPTGGANRLRAQTSDDAAW